MAEVAPLRRRMIEDIGHPQHIAGDTKSYIYAVAELRRPCGRSPDQLRLEDVRAYQLYTIAQQRHWPGKVCSL